MTARVDVRARLDDSRFDAYHWRIVAPCAAYRVMDGFDVQATGGVAPAVIREWGIAKEALSPAFRAGWFGMLIGSLVFSALAAVFAAIFMAAFPIVGGQPALNVLAAVYYPAPLRSTGIGWRSGVGWIGSVVGPVRGGVLMYRQWLSSLLFLAAAVPACVSMAGIGLTARPGFAGAGEAIGARGAAAAGE
ncbi:MULTISPECIES: hypothetical protein [Burkholderia]|uniref:hypothetical protein n=1 Tax=Burkholderia TaxID=32008 RepID=UPI0003251010|nr:MULTISPECIES: hypothetical protein [Burkholderia]ANW53344.1 transporter [Burkholderia pseudomallei]ANW59316.1 transporter [Burkholderia pseudomallei]AYE31974.1 transporter [Burkholderia pseudomallei]KIX69203.1 transporter [Burkholderia pseudomallei]KJR90757.1 transporter [Burkholderia pseudomallei]